MLQDMDNTEASGIIYIKVGRFDQLEPSKVCILTVSIIRIVSLIVQHDMIFGPGLYNIPGISGDTHCQTSFCSKNDLFITDTLQILAVKNVHLSL